MLLASDLGNMPFLQRVDVTLFDEGGCVPCRDMCVPKAACLRGLAKEMLALWKPPEGYPHKLLGDTGIFSGM